MLSKDPKKNMENIRTVRGCQLSKFESILLLLVAGNTDTTFRSDFPFIQSEKKRSTAKILSL